MPRMIDLIRASAVPSNIVQSAAKGSLSIPASETIEILVYLALHNPVMGERARLTLAGWDVNDLTAAASDPKSPPEVLEYLASPKNLRPALLPALLANPTVSLEALVKLAASVSRELVDAMLQNPRVTQSAAALEALSANPNLSGIQAEGIRERLPAAASDPASAAAPERSEEEPVSEEILSEESLAGADAGPDAVLEEEVNTYLAEHAEEISADGEKPFQPIGGFHQGLEMPAEEPLAEAAAAGSEAPAATTKRPARKKEHLSAEEKRGSTLQKISRLDVKGRIQLAMKGTKEERTILVRDGTKVVALAVLDSPKIGDAEVEAFASQKNVLEALLRAIPMKRRFAKHYGVIRNLVFNPRTPLDVSLGLMKNLLVNDLKHLSGNKEVSETIRKSALRLYRQKREPAK